MTASPSCPSPASAASTPARPAPPPPLLAITRGDLTPVGDCTHLCAGHRMLGWGWGGAPQAACPPPPRLRPSQAAGPAHGLAEQEGPSLALASRGPNLSSGCVPGPTAAVHMARSGSSSGSRSSRRAAPPGSARGKGLPLAPLVASGRAPSLSLPFPGAVPAAAARAGLPWWPSRPVPPPVVYMLRLDSCRDGGSVCSSSSSSSV